MELVYEFYKDHLHHYFQYHHYNDVSLSVVLPILFVACNMMRDLYWRYYKKYPPIASWIWFPFLGHFPLFAIAPKWFIRYAHWNNGGRPFVFDLFSYRFVICGRGETETMYRLKEELLEAEAGIMKLTNFDLTLGSDLFMSINHSGMTANAFTVRKYFTPNMDDHIRPMVEECSRVAHEWYQTNPLIQDIEELVLDMVAAAASRALLGKKLSSNPILAKEMKEFSSKVQKITQLSAVMPRSKLLEPAEKVSEAKSIISRFLIPEIRIRRKRIEEEKVSSQKGKDEEKTEPKTFLDYLLLQTEKDGKPLSDERICNCMFSIIFAAYDTTTQAVTNLLYDIAGQNEVMDEIFLEQENIRTRYDNKVAISLPGKKVSSEEEKVVDPIRYLSTKAIKDMHLLELALRESQRLGAHVFGPIRMVMKEGIKLRDGRTNLPKGALMTLSPWLLHYDSSIYKDPYEYKLRRFEEESRGFPSMKKFLNFGGGRHHCPGRFFATLEIKCIVSTLLSQFEISLSKPAPYTNANGITKRKVVPVLLKLRG